MRCLGSREEHPKLATARKMMRLAREGYQLRIKQGAKLVAMGWLATLRVDIELGSRTRRGCDTLG